MDTLKELIRKHPWAAMLVAILVGALFLATPVAVLVVKVRGALKAKEAASGGGSSGGANAAAKVAAETTNPPTKG